jgi:arylsulfatase A-like enzyme
MNVLVDWAVGQMYDALAEMGILDDTLFIFTSDNGPMRGENGQKSAGDLRGFKNMPFEGGHRIPFIARWPGRIAANVTSDAMICLTDLSATLAAFTGVDFPDTIEDSHNVLDALLDGGASSRPTLVSDTGGFASKTGDFAIRWDRWKLIKLARDDDDALAKRRRPVPDAVDGRLLFDLESDPAEEFNLIRERPALAAWLETVLEDVKQHGSRNVDPQPPDDLEVS